MGRKISRRRGTGIASAAASGGLAIFAGHQAGAQSVSADKQPDLSSAALQEVIVTASRRSADIGTIPYNISAYGAEDLLRTGTTDLAQLANQVPGFSLEDRGARYAAASVPIIRGLNASTTERPGLIPEQMPVATYIGNTPVTGYFPIEDIQRVEVLRGPQGTLYGASALGGAIRIIPNDPELNTFSAEVAATGSRLSHSSDTGYSASGLVNLPVGPIAALRISAKYDHEAGFVDQTGIVARTGNSITSSVVLATPGDVANSPAVYYNRSDANFTDVKSGRASFLLQPDNGLKVALAIDVSNIHGVGGPVDNPTFAGGSYPIDPRITLPANGRYSITDPTLEVFKRDSHLVSLDASDDLGFATVSSTSSYFDTSGITGQDETFPIFNLPAAYLPYYIGSPVNPRYVGSNNYADADHVLTQEIRLVSATGRAFDYVLGAFYERESRNLSWNFYEPGMTEQTAASGGVPVTTDPEGRIFIQTSNQRFSEKSLFGELTWHLTPRWEATVGTRVFWQDFSEAQAFDSFTFALADQGTKSNTTSDHIFKLNTAYEFVDNHRIYATYSQGFRRGGANAFPLEGPLRESPALSTYKPDKADNFEVGFKGRFDSGLRYTADVFYIDWKDPQIGTFTPVNSWTVAINAPAARSKGFEFEINTPLIIPNLSLTMGYAFVEAELSKDFCLPAGDGTGLSFIPCGITGSAGDRLPGTPESSGSATLTYSQRLAPHRDLIYSLNSTYKSSIVNSLPDVNTKVVDLPSYAFLNGNVTYDLEKLKVGFYAMNLLDHRAVFSAPQRTVQIVGNLANSYTISQPRQVGVRIAYHF